MSSCTDNRMRADIHDGPEHMLQSETEYIDARPHPAGAGQKPKASCTARPDHTFGPTTDIRIGISSKPVGPVV